MTDCKTDNIWLVSRWKKMLKKLGYLDFLDKASHSPVADKMKNKFTRRLTVVLLICIIMMMGAMVTQIFSTAFFEETDQDAMIYLYMFLGIMVVSFMAWLAEVALVVQVRSVVYQPFDERMQQLTLKSKEGGFYFTSVLLLIAILAGWFSMINPLELDYAMKLYSSITIGLLLLVTYAPLMVLSWQLPNELLEED
jgi:MFS family permease